MSSAGRQIRRSVEQSAKMTGGNRTSLDHMLREKRQKKKESRRVRRIVAEEERKEFDKREQQALAHRTLNRGDRTVERGYAGRLGGDPITSRRRLTV